MDWQDEVQISQGLLDSIVYHNCGWAAVCDPTAYNEKCVLKDATEK